MGKIDPTGLCWKWIYSSWVRIGPKTARAMNARKNVLEGIAWALGGVTLAFGGAAVAAVGKTTVQVFKWASWSYAGANRAGFGPRAVADGDILVTHRSNIAFYKGPKFLHSHHQSPHYVWEQVDLYRGGKRLGKPVFYGKVDVRVNRNGRPIESNVTLRSTFRRVYAQ